MTETVPTAEFASIVYGGDVPMDDPAEAFHEASRLYPNVAPPRVGVLTTLASSPELQQTTMRAARIHAHRPATFPRSACQGVGSAICSANGGPSRRR